MGYRDEKETLRRRVQELEEELEARGEVGATAEELAEELTDAHQTIGELQEELKNLRKVETKTRGARSRLEGLSRRVVLMVALGALVTGGLVYFSTHTALAVGAFALAGALVYRALTLKRIAASAPPAEPTRRRPRSKKKRHQRDRVRMQTRREEVEVRARQAPRGRRRR